MMAVILITKKGKSQTCVMSTSNTHLLYLFIRKKILHLFFSSSYSTLISLTVIQRNLLKLDNIFTHDEKCTKSFPSQQFIKKKNCQYLYPI